MHEDKPRSALLQPDWAIAPPHNITTRTKTRLISSVLEAIAESLGYLNLTKRKGLENLYLIKEKNILVYENVMLIDDEEGAGLGV